LTVHVRTAKADDAALLFGAWQSIRQHYADTDHRIIQAPVTESEFTAGLGETLAREASVTFVAEVDGSFAGFVSAGLEANQPDRLPERHATIGYLYVEPAARRKGVGRALFGAVAGWAQGRDGITHVEMPVLASDEGARAFWRALGFQPFIERLWAPLAGSERAE
jgi:GNAT superfamily N-acetyltransferase